MNRPPAQLPKRGGPREIPRRVQLGRTCQERPIAPYDDALASVMSAIPASDRAVVVRGAAMAQFGVPCGDLDDRLRILEPQSPGRPDDEMTGVGAAGSPSCADPNQALVESLREDPLAFDAGQAEATALL
jgi:hypothetical protein